MTIEETELSITFEERLLSGEPATDRQLKLACGTLLRERVAIRDARPEGVVSSAQNPAATALTIVISHALLDEENRVATQSGRPVIAPAYEISLTNEALGRLGSQEGIESEILAARERAAAAAALAMRGAELSRNLLKGRLPDELKGERHDD